MTTFTELDTSVQELLTMLTFMRGHNSPGEKAFCKKYMKGMQTIKGDMGASRLKSIGSKKSAAKGQDILAYYKVIGNAPVMWSSHVDSVHSQDGKVQIQYDPLLMHASTDGKAQLGADDGAGVWIMLEMIKAGVPGTYVFHRGEECGGLGSGAMADQHTDWLKQFKYAIAFDRRGNNSVITHQGRGRCCSDAFATAFGNAVMAAHSWLKLANDDSGVFTDTANYIDIIPECTNISVGYNKEHTYKETLDVDFLLRLRDGVIGAFKDGFDLPVERDPADVVPNDAWGLYDSSWTLPTTKHKSSLEQTAYEDDLIWELERMSYRDLVEFVEYSEPTLVAEALDILLSSRGRLY